MTNKDTALSTGVLDPQDRSAASGIRLNSTPDYNDDYYDDDDW